jgi:PAS domain-containing protein
MQYTIFMISSPIVAVIMIVVAFNIQRQERSWLTRSLAWAVWLCFGFLVTNTLELAWPTETGTILFAKLSYPFSTLIPVAFFLFSLAYTRHDRLLGDARRMLTLIIPFITCMLAFTEPLHGLIWTSVWYTPYGGMLAMNVTYGPWFWVSAAYSVGILAASVYLLARDTFHARDLYRAQSVLAIVGACVPLALFFIYTFKIFPGFTKNYYPIAYCVPGLCFMAAIRQHRFLDLVPVARRTLVEEMADAMIVVDAHARVLDANGKAWDLLGLPRAAIGITLPPGSSLRQALESTLVPGSPREIPLELRGEKHFYDARVTHVQESHGRVTASIVLLHDVTDTHSLLEEKNELIRELSAAAEEIKTLRGIIPICMYCKKVRDDEGFWHQVENYVGARSLAQFSHGLCPDCLKKLENGELDDPPGSSV